MKMFIIGFIVATVSAAAQDAESLRQPNKIDLSGPRVGFSVLGGENAKEVKDRFSAGPMLSVFGWQVERQFLSTKEGLAGLAELVTAFAGVEQGAFLPSLTGIIGLRFADGIEFGVGPHISLGGTAIVFAGGVTLQTESLNFPINAAVILGKGGTHFTFLVGFTTRSQ